MKNISMLINTADKRSHINPEIYGHFSEHLGRCIYNGMYVGENSEIPNIKGVRKDVIEAFKEIKMPVLRWPGGSAQVALSKFQWVSSFGTSMYSALPFFTFVTTAQNLPLKFL